MNRTVTTHTILLVDPCAELCELTQFILVSVGYDVLTATTADKAIQLAHETPNIDLLLVDSELSDMRSDHLAAYISMLHPAVSVIFTAGQMDEIEAATPCRVLRKPFTSDELRRAVRRTLATRPARAEIARAA